MIRYALTAMLTVAATFPGHAESSKMVSQRDQMIEAAGCFARTAPAMSANILAMPPDKARWEKTKQLFKGRWSCLPDGKMAVVVRNDMFYGELAGAMLDRDASKLDAIAARGAAEAIRPGTGLSDTAFMSAYAECLLASDPGKTANVLRTARATSAERAAIVAFGSKLSDCMPTDISYTMNIPDLRAHLAFAAYRSMLPSGGKSDA